MAEQTTEAPRKRSNPFYQAGWKPTPITKEMLRHIDSLPETMDVMPAQFHAKAQDHRCPGERGLMLATLEQAIRDYQARAYPTNPREERKFAKIQSWFDDEDTSWPYSFINLCDQLSINAPKIRRMLSQWRERNPTKPVSSFSRKCHSKDAGHGR